MNRSSVLLVYTLAILVGELPVVRGSLVLISYPATATDGEIFTMMCSGNQGGSRAWSRDGVYLVLYTHPGSKTAEVVSPLVTKDLVGRVTVSSNDNSTQHNISLVINADIDNGDVWSCTDEIRNERSNFLTIAAVTTSTTLTSKASTTSIRSSVSTRALHSVTTTTTMAPTITHSTPTRSSISASAQTSDPVTTMPLTTPTTVAFTRTTVVYGTTTEMSAAFSPSIPVIAGVAAAVVVIIAIAVAILFVRRNRRSNSRKDHQDSAVYAIPSAYDGMSDLYCELRAPRVHKLDETTASSIGDTQDVASSSSIDDTPDEAASSSYLHTYDIIGYL